MTLIRMTPLNPTFKDPCDPYVTERGSNGFDPSPGTAVEILMSDGKWQNSWIVTEGSTAFAVKVAKLGQPALTRSNLRWDVDVLMPAMPRYLSFAQLNPPMTLRSCFDATNR